ncbi:glycosyltransferase family 4 protein [Dysgonomonas sp. 520]|uniref:glycosyltransferase family 4 protein n=1 Tax=Dysgonomonas sp. 520 TaxID=2302931 RepID=UPI0013D11415|nr:glycosyltransferase family 4 protein [Dysgonomonas sp. 520]NDW08958.1 glycosyltransferase family 1 protein [Dysgonomonas sp. 520]
MNILHVVNIYFVIPYFLGDQLKYFHQKGYNMHIICSPSSELKNLSQKLRFTYKEIPILRKISIIDDLKSVYYITKYIKQNNIDIVMGHTPKGALVSMIAAYLTKVPQRIYFRHGLVYETTSGLKRFLMINIDRLTARLATKIINVSPSVSKISLRDKLNPPQKQIVLKKGTCNGINLERFNKNNIEELLVKKIKTKYNISEGSLVIGYTGRLVRDKGIIEFIDAFKMLRKKYDNLVLLLVGMFEDRDSLPINTIKEINDSSAIIHTNYVPNEEIAAYYSLMDIFVLPSYREGFPTSILEASAMEIPVITTRATGCIDSIIEGQTGYFVDHDALDIKDKIEQLILNKDRRVNFGFNGRNFVCENFNEKEIWKEIERLYNE